MDLSDVSNKDLIKKIKENPKDIKYSAEFVNRLDTGEVTGEEMLMYLEIMLFNGGLYDYNI